MTYDIRYIQHALGVPVDGEMGPITGNALIKFKVEHGFNANTTVGPNTMRALAQATETLPWMVEISAVMGLHEIEDHAVLSAWLASDDHALGDPAQLPWCGDAVETAMRRGLPEEWIPTNPYWAKNWSNFGTPALHWYGAVAVFGRNGGGHVGFLVGVSPDGKQLRIRGGNQSNQVKDSWLEASRLEALRWPRTYLGQPRMAPVLDRGGEALSRNEA